MYAIRLESGRITKRAKGVKKCIISKKITFQDFKNCVNRNCVYVNKQSTIKSHLHKIFTINTNKRMLDGNDDKRVILDDGIHTLAIGHYKNENSSIL